MNWFLGILIGGYLNKLVDKQALWLMVNTSLPVEKVIDFKETFRYDKGRVSNSKGGGKLQ